jgi:CheY-like chemotaxis protein
MQLEICFNIKSDVAYSGAEAVKLVEQRLEKLHKFGCSEFYRLILTDINMPEMDGIQMSRIIR